jgi:OpgC protein
MSRNRRGIPKTALNEDFAKKVRHSMRELQNDARKIPSFLQGPPSITPREYELLMAVLISPARVIHSLALTAIFADTIKIISLWIPRLPGFLGLLGRNSLSVFCALSLLNPSGQIFRFVYGGHVASDAFIAILGALLMGFIAWTAEWRERLRAALAHKPLSP